MEPSHEWDAATGTPSVLQRANLCVKQATVTAMFKPYHPVCIVSALTGWGIEEMVETMMRCLPDHATSPLATQLHDRLCTEPVKKQARDSFSHAVERGFDSVESSLQLPAPVRALIRTVRETVVSVARAVWDWIFF